MQIYEAIQSSPLAFPAEPKVSAQLQNLLRQLLDKDPVKRCSLEACKAHPWVTQGGALPALQGSAERAVQRVIDTMRLNGANKKREATVPLAPQQSDIKQLVPDAEAKTYADGQVIIE